MDPDVVPELELRLEHEGHKRWLLALRNNIVYGSVRVPLHIDKLPEARRAHAMQEICLKLKKQVELCDLGDRVIA